MPHRLQAAFDALLAHPRRVIAAWAFLALAAAPGVTRLGTDNSPSVYFVEGSSSLVDYRELRAEFGTAEPVRLLVTGEDLWTREGLAWLDELERRARTEVPDGAGAIGLIGRHRLSGRRDPIDPAAPADQVDKIGDPEAFQKLVLADRLDRQLGLVGVPTADGSPAATVLVSVEPDGAADGRALAALEALVARPPEGHAEGHAEGHGDLDFDGRRIQGRVVGLPVLSRALDESSREIGRVYFPLLAALAVLLLAATLRSVPGVVLPLLFVSAPEVVLLGAMGFLGIDLNLVLAVLPPLLFVISLATAIHLMVRFRDAVDRGLDAGTAVRDTYRDKGWAVFWTGGTTMIGFGSLVVSRVGPVPTLGLASAAGIALMTLAAFTLYPALLLAWGGGGGVRSSAEPGGHLKRTFELRLRRLGRAWADRAARRRGPVLALAALAMAVALAGLPRLRIESDAVRFLPTDHPVRAGIEELERLGIGAAPVEVLLTLSREPGEDRAATPATPATPATEGEVRQGFLRPEGLHRLERLAERLRGLPRTFSAVGGGDVFAAALAVAPVAGPGPGGLGSALAPSVVLETLLRQPEARRLLGAFVTEDGQTARVTLSVETAGYSELEPVLAAAGRQAREAFPEARVAVTGEFPLMLETHRRLLATLGGSLALTTLAVGLLLRALLPSTRLTLLALIPNLWPIAMTVGAMGWVGVPLDTATVMVASVVLGLAVDDTIHTLGHFRELAPVLGRHEAVAGTLERTAPAYVLTGVVLAVGFGVCALSDFAPTARFGGLSAFAIAMAVVGDLFLLPALLGATPRAVVDRLERASPRR